MIALLVLELLNFNVMLVLLPGASETMLSVMYVDPINAAQVVRPDESSNLALLLRPKISSESGPGIAAPLVFVRVIVCVY